MLVYFKFLWTEINFSTFMAFLWGTLFGALLIVFVYVMNVLGSLRKSRYIMKNRIKTIDKEEIDVLIQNAQNDFLVKRKEKDAEKGYLQKIIFGLVNDIAKMYFPKSKKPVAELTFDELILLSHYITDTVDQVLSRPAVKIFKRMKLSTVLNIVDITNSKAVKTAKEVSKWTKYASMAFHCINPFYWFKKAVFDTSFALITKKITLVVIAVVGEQTNKVFSKEALYEESDQINQLLDEIDSDMKNMEEEAKKEEKEANDLELTHEEKKAKKREKVNEQELLEQVKEEESEKDKKKRLKEEKKQAKLLKKQQKVADDNIEPVEVKIVDDSIIDGDDKPKKKSFFDRFKRKTKEEKEDNDENN